MWIDADAQKRLLATEKSEMLKVSGFSTEIQKFLEKKKIQLTVLYPPTTTIQIVRKLQIGAYLGRAVANLNSDNAPFSQSLKSVKMLADLLPMGINAYQVTIIIKMT